MLDVARENAKSSADLEVHGIEAHPTTPYTPKENGRAECVNNPINNSN